MHSHDFDEFASLLDDAYDLIGSGANKTISAGAKSLFFASMSEYSLSTVRAALSAHCMDKVRGRFTPKPADLIEQIETATANDGRPGGEEAWAIALGSQDEAETVVWTAETAQAFAICRPVLDSSGAISARKTFLEAYARLVAESRAARQPAQWSASLGWDKTRQVAALNNAAARGLLPAPTVAGLLPPPKVKVQDDDQNALAQLAKIRQMLMTMNAEKVREGELHAQRERQKTSDAKAKAQTLTTAYTGERAA